VVKIFLQFLQSCPGGRFLLSAGFIGRSSYGYFFGNKKAIGVNFIQATTAR